MPTPAVVTAVATTRRHHAIVLRQLAVSIVLSGLMACEVADAVGISRPQLSSYLRGHRSPGPQVRARLAEVLGVPEAELFPELAEVTA